MNAQGRIGSTKEVQTKSDAPSNSTARSLSPSRMLSDGSSSDRTRTPARSKTRSGRHRIASRSVGYGVRHEGRDGRGVQEAAPAARQQGYTNIVDSDLDISHRSLVSRLVRLILSPLWNCRSFAIFSLFLVLTHIPIVFSCNLTPRRPSYAPVRLETVVSRQLSLALVSLKIVSSINFRNELDFSVLLRSGSFHVADDSRCRSALTARRGTRHGLPLHTEFSYVWTAPPCIAAWASTSRLSGAGSRLLGPPQASPRPVWEPTT